MANIGYARVSTEEQNLDLQMTALRSAGCTISYEDRGVSGQKTVRPGLDQALGALAPDDTLVVWRLDRLGRSLRHLVDVLDELNKRGVHFRSLTESIDTTTPGGMLVFHMMAALAQFERSLISERTKAGLAAARLRGSRVGRSAALSPEQRAAALFKLSHHPIASVAAEYRVCERTIRRLRSRGGAVP